MAREQDKYPGFYRLYVSLLKDGVIEDLENHKELYKKIGMFKESFVNWCSKQRVNYEHDIYDEVNEFLTKFLKKRMYNFNLPLWKEISRIVFERDNYTCLYCNKKGGNLEVDHIIPLSKNGTNELENLVTSCRTCNRQKRDKTVKEFMEWRVING